MSGVEEQEGEREPVERDPSTYSEEEKAMVEKYGRLPKKTDLIKKRNDRLKGGNKRFDSADWELKKGNNPGTQGPPS